VAKYDNTINTGFQIPACKKKKTVLCFTEKIVAACGPLVTLLLFLGVVAVVATQIVVRTNRVSPGFGGFLGWFDLVQSHGGSISLTGIVFSVHQKTSR
jgi:hypothetical protein